MASTATVTNGIDLEQLTQTIETIKQDPNLGSFRFRATSTWDTGTYNRGEIGAFIIRTDEFPPNGRIGQVLAEDCQRQTGGVVSNG